MQRLAQGRERARRARFDRAERDVLARRDLRVGEPLVERDLERLALRLGERGERAADLHALGRVARERLGIGRGRDRLVREDVARERAAAIAAAGPIDRQVAHQRDEPRRDRAALGGVLPGPLAHRQERVVQHVLRLRPVAHDAQRQRGEHGDVAVVELPDGVTIARADTAQ